MILIFNISLLFISIYAVFILHLRRVYLLGAKKRNAKNNIEANISIVVPFRNEEQNLAHLLETISNQSYPKEKIELIFVNDHSTDNGEEEINKTLETKGVKYKVLDNSGSGKKSALKCGVLEAKSSIILQTDADCRLPEDWVYKMVSAFEDEKVKAVIGTVKMQAVKHWASKLVALEFLSLQASGMALAYKGIPIMSNGASLAYKKKSWLEHHDRREKWASGDDVFFIQSLAKQDERSISVAEGVSVETNVPESLASFFKQRIRWGGKTYDYPLKAGKWIALMVLLVNLFLVSILILSVWLGKSVFGFWLGLTFLKLIADYSLIKAYTKRNKGAELLGYVLPTALLYPIYILVSAIFIIIAPAAFSWKGRKIKN